MSDNTSTPDVFTSAPGSPGNSSSSGCSSGNSPSSVVLPINNDSATASGMAVNSSPVAVSVITSPSPRLEAADGALPISAQPTASATLPSMLRSILAPGDVNTNAAALGNMPLLSSLINPTSDTTSLDLTEANTHQNLTETGSPPAELDLSIKVEPLSPPGIPPLPTAFLSSPSPQANEQCSFEGRSVDHTQPPAVNDNPTPEVHVVHTSTQG
jgi:hypothetical protein